MDKIKKWVRRNQYRIEFLWSAFIILLFCFVAAGIFSQQGKCFKEECNSIYFGNTIVMTGFVLFMHILLSAFGNLLDEAASKEHDWRLEEDRKEYKKEQERRVEEDRQWALEDPEDFAAYQREQEYLAQKYSSLVNRRGEEECDHGLSMREKLKED